MSEWLLEKISDDEYRLKRVVPEAGGLAGLAFIILIFRAISDFVEFVKSNWISIVCVIAIIISCIIAIAIIVNKSKRYTGLKAFLVIILGIIGIWFSVAKIPEIRNKSKLNKSESNSYNLNNFDFDVFYVNQKNLNLRSGAGTSYSVKKVLVYGTKVYVTDDSRSDWWKVKILGTGEEGFVNKKYLSAE